MTLHSRIGASSAQRVMSCPGSVPLAETVPPLPESEYAAAGTARHEAMAIIMQRQVAYAEDVIGLELNGHMITEEIFDEDIQPASDAFSKLVGFVYASYMVESRVRITGIEDAFGTADVIGVTDEANGADARRVGFVVDWKFGSGAVSPVDNPQLMFYALGAIDTFPTVFEGVDEFRLAIIQPPAHDDEPQIWETDRARLEKFRLEFAAAVRLTKSDNPKIKAGDWCRWCPAKPLCPLKTQAAADIVGRNIGDLNSDEIGELVKLSFELEDWSRDIRVLAHEMLDNGKDVTGCKLIAKRATRSWIDDAATAAALRKMRLRVKDIYPKKLISPAQAEKVLKAKGKTVPEELIQAISSGTTLALESHKSPAVMGGKKALKALGDRLKTL